MDDAASLSPFQESLVRSAFDGHVEFTRARYLQALRPCPILVDVLVDGTETSVVLRIARNEGGVECETLVYSVAGALNLPVPRVLVGPKRDPAAPELFSMSVVERLSGETLQVWAEGPGRGVNWASEMFLEAYRLLNQATPAAVQASALAGLPRRTLADDLEDVVRRSGDWLRRPEIQDVVGRIGKEVERIDVPLTFTNGDFAPANFLADGTGLTGMLDFEKAAFVDPLTVPTRIPVYDHRPFSQIPFLDRLLARHGFTQRDFAPRVAVFCLRTLQTKVPVDGGTPSQRDRREHVLRVLEVALEHLS